MSNPSRKDLLNTAKSLCEALATKRRTPLDKAFLGKLMSEDVLCWDHGLVLDELAPSSGRPFRGLDGAQQYFALIGDYQDDMIFSDYYTVEDDDAQTREVSVRGTARFIWKEHQREEHHFVCRLRLDRASKITHYEVWGADSGGTAHLARRGHLLGRGRIVLLTYEFTFAPFSGNGILARSLVKSLLQLGYAVTVWCCKPMNSQNHDQNSQNQNNHNHLEFPELPSPTIANRLELIPITLQPHHTWRKLDHQSAWEYFVMTSLSDVQQNTLLRHIRTAVAVCVIDWTGAHAVRSLQQQLQMQQQQLQPKQLVYLNFRVYSSGIADAQQHEWYDRMETMALENADRIIALSDRDKMSLSGLLSKITDKTSTPKDIDILLPPLRGDMWKLATESPDDLKQYLPPQIATLLAKATTTTTKQRFLLTCVVRQSPEKTVLRFITFIRETRDLISDLGIVPVLAGSRADPEYAARLKRGLLEIVPNAIVLESFLSPQSLGAIFSRTILNFHPCAYDAYGMTIVEAAAQGVVSVVASGKTVGASALLGVHGADTNSSSLIEVDMPKEDETKLDNVDIDKVRALMKDSVKLEMIGEEARRKALAWDEAAYGTRLIEIIQQQKPQ